MAGNTVGRSRSGPRQGFTLIEVLVALTLMALLALMSWRGLDAMLRARQNTSVYGDELMRLQTSLAQWQRDLDMLVDSPEVGALRWDAPVLRLVRRSADNSAWLVVAWRRRAEGSAATWQRWQSAPLKGRAELLRAWEQALSAGPEDSPSAAGAGGVRLLPLGDWQLFYYREGVWSPAAADAGGSAPATLAGVGPTAQSAQTTPSAQPTQPRPAPPDGVRLQLLLPPGGPLPGWLRSDWANPAANRPRP